MTRNFRKSYKYDNTQNRNIYSKSVYTHINYNKKILYIIWKCGKIATIIQHFSNKNLMILYNISVRCINIFERFTSKRLLFFKLVLFHKISCIQILKIQMNHVSYLVYIHICHSILVSALSSADAKAEK